MLSLIGLLAALGLLVMMTMRGMNLFLATPLCALLVAVTSDLALLPPLAAEGQGNLIGFYMQGFSGFVSNWFFMFLLGSIFGKLMEDSGAATSLAMGVMRLIGPQRAALGVVLACAILTYGGVSVFVVAFAVYPTALVLFREADLPRRFIPGALAFGSITFTMTTAGSPEIQNWIPIQYLGTSPWAAWQASLITAAFMAVVGHFWLNWMLARAKARGERFDVREADPTEIRTDLPAIWRASLPPLAVIGLSLLLHGRFQTSALILALLGGSFAIWFACGRYFCRPSDALAHASTGALIAIGNTAAVVGFGAVAKAAPAFMSGVNLIIESGGGTIASAALAVTLISALAGSSSGGQAIALPLLAPAFLANGVNPDQLHRAVAIASGGLDSLPHNGYVVTTVRAICGETHRAAYGPIGILTVIVPCAGLVVCLALFALGL